MAITPLQKTPELYSDFDLALTRNPVTNDLSRNLNTVAIKESVKNIVLTNHGERPFRPLFGGNIRAQLFESHTPATLKSVETSIRTALNTWEPRIELLGVKVTSDVDTNEINAYIEFVPINSEQATTLNVLLKRVR